MADSKKLTFSTPPILNIFLWKFHGWVLGLVGLNDAKGIEVAQPIGPWGCPTYAPKRPKNTKNAFFACFRTYVRQPHGHIGWATLIPFASINCTNPRPNPWNFWKKNIENWQFWKKSNWVLRKCFIPIKISHKLCVRMNGTQFLWLWWFTAKNHSPQTFQPAVY